MTITHPALRHGGRVALLGERDRSELQRLLDTDPIVNAVICARVRECQSLAPAKLGGTMLGVRGAQGLAGAAYHGGNLVPIEGDRPAWESLARSVADRPRLCTSIVGRTDAVATMWEILGRRWGAAREVRPAQPLLVLNYLADIAGDDSVRLAGLDDVDRYVAASAAMFTEELGMSPHRDSDGSGYRTRVIDLIKARRAFASFDFRGQVLFKADIGAVSAHTCQVNGVWVRPDVRGRGIATAALATVFRHALTLAPSVSLYVNDFNAPARRVYEKLGMQHHATLSTVLL
ncbi:MAG: GNAT family N-acetyltransferase [Jatrophihabitantaceae bacterium]